ncbi:lanthionine synthetase LanC family protein [Pedobacter cryoconitis]|uniref:Lanthionine synthetase-like protein n=1 Tax=Pedobacter cryoconitis TaxID=188932 RepID=A0A327STT6_9SPHI|nr:lanthionine synthetase LanC family protein [Pedobacter cryoconitis]RAJ31932.1 lanthionine synthetase-like protein [Pedobacter cryoconitis]
MYSFTHLQTQRIHKQLAQVKNDLLASCKRDEIGVYWQSPFYETAEKFSFQTTVDIFNGNSGIALFYIGLFELSGDREDLKMAADIVNKVLQEEAVLKPRSFGFYTGITGVIYVCIKLYEHNKEEQYLRHASQLLSDNQENIVNNTVKADLLSGYSGSLLVITLLYHHLQTKNLLTIIHQLVDRIIKEARISEFGLKWDYNQSKSSFDSLAGFSHGASGIACVLMQVGNYFKNDGLIYLAEQALAYEMQYFDSGSGNWLDLRLGKFRLSLPDAHRWDLDVFIPEMNKVNSWAHGAGGIGLARLFAYELTGKEIYLEQCELVMKKCSKDLEKMHRTDFTLCSGYTGLLPFLSRFADLQQKNYAGLILSVVDQAGVQYARKRSYNTYISANQFDYGLLSGKSGVGYILLQLLNKDMESVIYPVLPLNDKGHPVIAGSDKSAIRQRIFSTYYVKTISLLDQLEPDFMLKLQAEDFNELEARLDQKISRLPDLEEYGIAEVFDFEQKMAARWKLHKGYLCYKKKKEFILDQAKQLSVATTEELCGLSFVLNDHVSFYPLNKKLKRTMGLLQSYQAALFMSEESGVSTVYIGQLSMLILNYLYQQAMTGQELISLILADFLPNAQQLLETTVLRERILLQMRSLIISGMIGLNENV